jgi:hypothetical protein
MPWCSDTPGRWKDGILEDWRQTLGKRLHSHHSILPTFHHSWGNEENSHSVRAAILGQNRSEEA